jgi:hypothetical protein
MFRRALAAVLPLALVAAALVPSAAQPPKPPDAAPADAALVVSVNVKKLWTGPSSTAIREARGRVEFGWLVNALIGFTPDKLDRVTLFWTGGKELSGPFVLADAREAFDPAKVLDALPRAGNETGVKTLADGLLSIPGAEFPLALKVADRSLLLAPKGEDAKAVAKLAGGLRRDAAGPVVAIRATGAALAAVPNFKGAKELTFTLDAPNDPLAAAKLTLTYADAAAAKDGVAALDTLLTFLKGWSATQQKAVAAKPFEQGTPGPLLEVISAALKGVKVKADGATVVATTEFDMGDAVRGLVMAVPDSAFAGRGGNSAAENNLKQIGLAQHSYSDTTGKFPGNSYSKDGKPLLSWRVHILPYIEQDALYKQFKLDEPWDSDHNIKLSKTVVRTFSIPGRPAPLGETYYRCFTATKTAKPEYRPWLLDGSPDGPKIAQITDGTSNTLMVVEAGESVLWTKPDDLPYDGVMPVPPLGGASGRFMAVFGDGSVRTFRRQQLDDKNLRGMITIGGGEVISIP